MNLLFRSVSVRSATRVCVHEYYKMCDFGTDSFSVLQAVFIRVTTRPTEVKLNGESHEVQTGQ